MTTATFDTPGSYTWTAPAGLTTLVVKLWGASGGDNIDGTLSGGLGGYLEVDVTGFVTVGDVLQIVVGTEGQSGTPGTTTSGYGQSDSAAFGDGGIGDGDAGAGGGYALVINTTTNQLLAVAGGGGGAGAASEIPAAPPFISAPLAAPTSPTGHGGEGGFPAGSDGADATPLPGGTAGTASAHGTPASSAFEGDLRRNARDSGGSKSAARAVTIANGFRAGGAGGAGYRGGGSGLSTFVGFDLGAGTYTTPDGNTAGSGGGGGSSWAVTTTLDDATGVRSGDALITFDYTATPGGGFGFGLSLGPRGTGFHLG